MQSQSASSKRKPDAREAYRRAGELLSREGRRMLLIEAIIFCLVMVSVYVMLYQVFFLLIETFADTDLLVGISVGMYYLLACVLTVFVTLPLLLGLMHLGGKISDGQTPVLVDLFRCFSSPQSYLRALSLSWGGFWRMLCVVLAVAATCGATVYFFPGELWAGLLCGVAVFWEILLWLFLVLRGFATYAVAFYDTFSLKQARSIANMLNRHTKCGGLRFFFALLPHILLGLLTLGVYLLWDVLPRMGVAYFLYCKQMNDRIIQSEE